MSVALRQLEGLKTPVIFAAPFQLAANALLLGVWGCHVGRCSVELQQLRAHRICSNGQRIQLESSVVLHQTPIFWATASQSRSNTAMKEYRARSPGKDWSTPTVALALEISRGCPMQQISPKYVLLRARLNFGAPSLHFRPQ